MFRWTNEVRNSKKSTIPDRDAPGEIINPVTRSVPNGKAYNRKKEKERISKEFRDGFGADSFLLETEQDNIAC